MQIECPNCHERTLRDPKAHPYLGTRCEGCGAEFDVVGGELVCVSPGTEQEELQMHADGRR